MGDSTNGPIDIKKHKNTTLSEQLQNPIKFVYRVKIDTPNTQIHCIHYLSLFWIGPKQPSLVK